MLLEKIKRKVRSDDGAMGSVETILLIALAVLSVVIITKYIMGPIQDSSEGIGNVIKEMNPEWWNKGTSE